MKLTFLGTGEAADPDLPNTSLLVETDKQILLDCGYSVPRQLWQVSSAPDFLDAVIISHAHADHYFGLPALLIAMHDRSRTKPLIIMTGSDTMPFLKQLIALAYPGTNYSFPIQLMTVLDRADLDDTQLRFAASTHAVTNLACSITHNMKTLCYSGDGALTEATKKLYDGSDFLVHETFSLKAGNGMHGNVHDVVKFYNGTSVSQLAVAHIHVPEKKDVTAWLESNAPDVIIPIPFSSFDIE